MSKPVPPPPPKPLPIVEVFLTFWITDRNNYTVGKKTTYTDVPDWNDVREKAAAHGYLLVIHGPFDPAIATGSGRSISSSTPRTLPAPSIQEVEASMTKSEVTLLVGHGHGQEVGTKFVSTFLQFNNGVLEATRGILPASSNTTDIKQGRLTINRVTGVFTCNSDSSLPGGFDVALGSHLITNDGGADGLTRVGTLERAAAAFVLGYVNNQGSVSVGLNQAQQVFAAAGTVFATDKGDRLHEHAGQLPDNPPTYAPPIVDEIAGAPHRWR